jgi:serine protease inhibitor
VAFSQQASALQKRLNSQSGNGTQLVIANALWTKDLAVRKAYAEEMKSLYSVSAGWMYMRWCPVCACRSKQQLGQRGASCLPVRLSLLPCCPLNHVAACILLQAEVQAVSSAAPINAWAARVTNGLITKAVPPDVEFNMIITNAVYFKGLWEYAFDKAATRKRPFSALASDRSSRQVCDGTVKQLWEGQLPAVS